MEVLVLRKLLLSLIVVLSALASGCGIFPLREKTVVPQMSGPPIKLPAPSTIPKEPMGPSWSATGVFGGLITIPGGMQEINAKRITGRWPDGSSVVIYDFDTDGYRSPSDQWQLVVAYEREWARRKLAAPQP